MGLEISGGEYLESCFSFRKGHSVVLSSYRKILMSDEELIHLLRSFCGLFL